MTEELNPTVPPSVGAMLRMTGANTNQFMEQVAIHIEKLESEIARLTTRISELELVEVSNDK